MRRDGAGEKAEQAGVHRVSVSQPTVIVFHALQLTRAAEEAAEQVDRHGGDPEREEEEQSNRMPAADAGGPGKR